jgi:hypothetical protein
MDIDSYMAIHSLQDIRVHFPPHELIELCFIVVIDVVIDLLRDTCLCESF